MPVEAHWAGPRLGCGPLSYGRSGGNGSSGGRSRMFADLLAVRSKISGGLERVAGMRDRLVSNLCWLHGGQRQPFWKAAAGSGRRSGCEFV